MDALLVAIALWLSANFDLPPNAEPPRIEFVSPDAITSMRYRAFVGPLALGATQRGASDVLSVYNDKTRTIYLRNGWVGKSPSELSILVHEIVHHLQNIGHYKFECPQQRERLAYSAQDQWLQLFGRNLEQDFELDEFSLFVKSACAY